MKTFLVFISILVININIYIYGQEYSPKLDENDIKNYIMNHENIWKELLPINNDDTLYIEESEKTFYNMIRGFIYENKYTENEIKLYFNNFIETFIPKEVYEIFEKYGVYNKNFYLLFNTIFIFLLHNESLEKGYFNIDEKKILFLFSLVDSKDIDLMKKYYYDFTKIIE